MRYDDDQLLLTPGLYSVMSDRVLYVHPDSCDKAGFVRHSEMVTVTTGLCINGREGMGVVDSPHLELLWNGKICYMYISIDTVYSLRRVV